MATLTAVPASKIRGGSFLIEERTPEEVFTPEDFSERHQLIAQTAEEFARFGRVNVRTAIGSWYARLANWA